MAHSVALIETETRTAPGPHISKLLYGPFLRAYLILSSYDCEWMCVHMWMWRCPLSPGRPGVMGGYTLCHMGAGNGAGDLCQSARHDLPLRHPPALIYYLFRSIFLYCI